MNSVHQKQRYIKMCDQPSFLLRVTCKYGNILQLKKIFYVYFIDRTSFFYLYIKTNYLYNLRKKMMVKQALVTEILKIKESYP